MFDWERLKQASLRGVIAAAGGTSCQMAALAELYAERDGIISAPLLYLNTSGENVDSPPDWEEFFDDWAPGELMDELTAYAGTGSVAHWDETFARYQDLLVEVCNAAAAQLGVPIFYVEHSRYEDMLRRTLTETQLSELFPQVVVAQTERERVGALTVEARLAYYVSRLGRFDGPIDSEEAEEALCRLGTAAIPALLALLAESGRAWEAARLLMRIGMADPAVVDALSGALEASAPDSPEQNWVCTALACLGRLDVVLAKETSMSQQAIAVALVAPYTGTRDQCARPLPLDYRPLEAFLSERPGSEAVVGAELTVGRTPCRITAQEVPEALRGTASPHAIVRRHAVDVLGWRELNEPAIVPILRKMADGDPDPEVRRVAGLSLEGWKIKN